MTHTRCGGVEQRPVDLTAVAAPGGVSTGVAAPASLRTWVEKHVSGSGGAALAGLVSLLRERGYLSHGLLPSDPAAVWTQSLPGYQFQPSASGHSLARIDALFTRLLERETDPRAAASGNYVAAVGDDEQFAVAVALIARELGFPARVVLGARLAATAPGLSSVRRRSVPRAGPRGVDRGPVARGGVDPGRRDAAVRAVAEPRRHRAARPRERHRGATRLGARRGAARAGAERLHRRRHSRPGRRGRSRVALACAAHAAPSCC